MNKLSLLFITMLISGGAYSHNCSHPKGCIPDKVEPKIVENLKPDLSYVKFLEDKQNFDIEDLADLLEIDDEESAF